MENSPLRPVVTMVPIYFTTTVQLLAEDVNNHTISEQVGLLERLSDPKDWIIGLVVGVLGGLAAVVFLSFRVPKLTISRYIAKPHPGKKAHTIQVTNKRRWWGLITGDAIDIRAELHVVTKYDRGEETVTPPIPLVRSDPFIIPHRRRFGRLPKLSQYIFDVKDQGNSQPDLESRMKSAVAIRFRVYARDSFSNYGKIFTLYYQKRGPGWWEGRRDWVSRLWRRDLQLPYPVIECRAARKIHPQSS